MKSKIYYANVRFIIEDAENFNDAMKQVKESINGPLTFFINKLERCRINSIGVHIVEEIFHPVKKNGLPKARLNKFPPFSDITTKADGEEA